MSNTDNTSLSTWERIQNGVRDTERCIGQKKYNMAMVKARQTLEYMVTCLCEKSGTPEGSLIDMIDNLYEDGAISKTTSEHYHKIRTIGNKAIHEDDNSAYNANQAHHLLSQEVYTFANDYKERRRKPAAKRQSSADISERSRASAASASSAAVSSRSSGSRSSRAAGAGSGRSMSAGSSRTMSSGSNRRRTRTSRSSIDLETILKPLLLVAIIIVLIFIIKMIHPSQEDAVQDTDPAVTTEAPLETEAVPEVPEETAPAQVIYKTTDILNVRSTPSTDNERIGVLNAGAEVEYVGDYDEKWAIIKVNGSDAYVVKEYLVQE